jgi:hypothetical protein
VGDSRAIGLENSTLYWWVPQLGQPSRVAVAAAIPATEAAAVIARSRLIRLPPRVDLVGGDSGTVHVRRWSREGPGERRGCQDASGRPVICRPLTWLVTRVRFLPVASIT